MKLKTIAIAFLILAVALIANQLPRLELPQAAAQNEDPTSLSEISMDLDPNMLVASLSSQGELIDAIQRATTAQMVVDASTYPEEIAFANECRADAELLRAVRLRFESRLATWARLSGTFSGAPGVELDDGRTDEGISRLTTNDIVSLMTQVQGVYDVLKANAQKVITEKPCVRPVQAPVLAQ